VLAAGEKETRQELAQQDDGDLVALGQSIGQEDGVGGDAAEESL